VLHDALGDARRQAARKQREQIEQGDDADGRVVFEREEDARLVVPQMVDHQLRQVGRASPPNRRVACLAN